MKTFLSNPDDSSVAFCIKLKCSMPIVSEQSRKIRNLS